MDALETRLEGLRRLAGVEPVVIACDLHPGYVSHALAKQFGVRVIDVQHHHAHARACLLDAGATLPALALVLDGAGWGTDGTVWGGELLRIAPGSFERLAHLEQVRWPGGEAAVREPWRIAAVWLQRAFPEGAPTLPWHKRHSPQVLAYVTGAAERGIHSPITSSSGRLFDALASLLDLGDVATHEGELAMALESLAAEAADEPDSWSIPVDPVPTSSLAAANPRPPREVPVADIVRELVLGLARGEARERLAQTFHVRLAARWVHAITEAARSTGLNTVALSGGCMQNRLLATLLIRGLHARGLEPVVHHHIPANDGGLAVGQALVAAEILVSERSAYRRRTQ